MSLQINKLNNFIDQDGNNIFTFTNTKSYTKLGEIRYEYLIASYAFAYGMSFTEEGHHRRNRSGGTEKRKKVPIFCDTFIGKLGEFAVYQYLRDQGIKLRYPDVSILGEGEWDSYDFTYENIKIGVKTTKKSGQLLLLETKDWNKEGQYLPNIKKGHSDYDDFLFVRINSDIVANLKQKKIYYKNDIKVDILEEEFRKAAYEFDIGHISIDLLKKAINNGNIIDKGVFLQSTRTKMDAENYYIQSGNMFSVTSYVDQLKGK